MSTLHSLQKNSAHTVDVNVMIGNEMVPWSNVRHVGSGTIINAYLKNVKITKLFTWIGI